jgi:hypothetical protein
LFLKKIASFFKKICNSKNLRTFAAHNILRGDETRLKQAGFFYAPLQKINGVTPVGNCNRTPASEVLCNGSVTPFFCYHKQNISDMHNTEKNYKVTSDHESVKIFKRKPRITLNDVMNYIAVADKMELRIIALNLLNREGSSAIWYQVNWKNLIDLWQNADDKSFAQMLIDEMHLRNESPNQVFKGILNEGGAK